MAQAQLGSTDHRHGVDLLASVIHGLAGLGSVVDVRVVQLVARHGESHQVQHSLLLLGRLLIVLEGERTQLAGADSVVAQQLDAEAHAGEGEGRHVGNALEELVHVQVHGVASGGQHHGQAFLGELLRQATHLIDAALQVGVLLDLEETHSAAHHIAAAESSVRIVSVLKNLLLLDARSDLDRVRRELLREQTAIAEGEQTADVHQTVLLQGHGEAVAVLEALLQNARNRPGLVRLLELLDEARVLHAAAGVEHQRQVVLLAHIAHLLDVLQGHGLAGSRVVGDGQQHEGNRVHALLLDHGLQTLNVHVALEGVLRPHLLHGERVVQVLREQIHRLEQVVASVSLGGVEEAVAGNRVLDLIASALHQHLAHGLVQKVLSATTLRADEEVGALQLEHSAVHEASLAGLQKLLDQLLVGRLVGQHLVHKSSLLISTLEQITSGIQKAVISMITTVSFISAHQSTPLNIGHGRRARVRKIIDSDQGRGEREHVVLRLLQNITTFFHGAVTKHQGQILPTTECFSRCTAEQWGQRN